MKLRPRFSLRWLMLFVAAVGIFCAYHVNWIRQRHELLKELLLKREAVLKHDYGNVSAIFCGRTSSLNCLWLFGESSQDSVEIVFTRTVTDKIDRNAAINLHSAVINLHKEELERAKTLFPEADIFSALYLVDNDVRR